MCGRCTESDRADPARAAEFFKSLFKNSEDRAVSSAVSPQASISTGPRTSGGGGGGEHMQAVGRGQRTVPIRVRLMIRCSHATGALNTTFA